jgi:hypothetical protein
LPDPRINRTAPARITAADHSEARFELFFVYSPIPFQIPFISLTLRTRMKRCFSAIVDYGSSSDDDAAKSIPLPKKKSGFPTSPAVVELIWICRKLPALSTTLVVPVPVENPVLHQGRTRTVPHVDGNWAAHIYLSIIIDSSHTMCTLLESTIAEAQRSVPALQSLIPGQDNNKHRLEFHISLSRPVFIRAHQKEMLRRAVRKLAQRAL